MIITLCGSTRFKDVFEVVNKLLSVNGHVVYSVAFYGHHEQMPPDYELGTHASWKTTLDRVHRRKIDASDAIFIIDVGGYMGPSTRAEMEYALDKGKDVYFLSKRFELREDSS